MTELNDAVVVVTGGATGIGLALAREAVRRKARVMLLDVNDARQAVAELRDMGGTAESVTTDVCNIEDVRQAVAETTARFGEVNIVCNNAGTGIAARLQETDPADADRLLRLNIGGAFNVIHAFTPSLQAAAAAERPAYVLNTGSEHSLGVPPHVPPFSVYTVTKHAMLGLTLTARRDLGPDGITVAMLAPGWTRTENVQAIMDSSPEMTAIIAPYMQESREVAAIAFDELLAGTKVIATNPHSRAFAIEHAADLLSDIRRLPVVESPSRDHHGTQVDVAT